MRIHYFIFLLFIQSFLACQAGMENVTPMSAGLLFPTEAGGQQCTKAGMPPATDIIYQSTDGGQTWQDVSAGLPVGLRPESVFANEDEIFLGHGKGLYRSSTASSAPKWQESLYLKEGISNILPGLSGPYAYSYEQGFFREVPGTGLWFPIYADLKEKRVRSVLDTPDGAVLAACDRGIFKSKDGGKNWRQVSADSFIYRLAAGKGVILATAYGGMLRSTDGGEHWEKVLAHDTGFRKIGRIGDDLVAILSDKGSVEEQMADPDGLANSIVASKDGGKTWRRMDEGIRTSWFVFDPEMRAKAKFINDIEQVGEYLFCSLDAGIFRSSDQGKTWELVLPTSDEILFNFAVSGKVIYALRAGVMGGC